MRILGIDPGKRGALAVLDTAEDRVVCHDLPGTLPALQDLLIALPPVRFCVLEQLHAGPQMSRTAVAAMFEGFGALKAALAFQVIPLRLVRPHLWKSALNVSMVKGTSRARAAEFFPADAGQWRLARHDGRAEAALIAWYGKRWL